MYKYKPNRFSFQTAYYIIVIMIVLIILGIVE